RQSPGAGNGESHPRVRDQGSLQSDRHRAGRQYAGRSGEVFGSGNRQMGQGHHHRRRQSGAMKALAAVLLLAASAAWAQSWPARPLRYIVPFPPDAFTDTLARALPTELPTTLGQPVVVENRLGG